MDDQTRKVSIENISMNAVTHVTDERRLPIQLLLKYWEKARGSRLFPSEKSINPEDISDIWDYCFLIQINDIENRQKIDFTYLGSELIKTYREYFSDEDAFDIISPHSSRLSQNFNRVATTKEPVIQSGVFINSRGNTIRFRQCLLPLGEDDNKVEAIFGCARLKVYP